MQNLLYFTAAHLPNQKAHSVQILKMCDTLSKYFKTYLICRKKKVKSIKKKFNIKNSFKILNLYDFDNIVINLFSKFYYLSKYKRNEKDILYTRDVHFAFFGYFIFKKIYLELHFPFLAKNMASFYFILFLSKIKKINFIFISNELLKIYKKKINFKYNNQIIAHSASENLFIKKYPKKKKLKIGYCGHLYPGRGINLIFKIAEKLKTYDFNILGGFNEDLLKIKKKIVIPKNIIFFKHIEYSKIKNFLSFNDILIAPYEKKNVYAGHADTSKFMSPLKIFEYMSSKKPMIVSNHIVLKEVLKNNKNAILCDPENLNQWLKAIKKLKNPQIRNKISNYAYNDFVNKYTWDKRVRKIFKIK